METSIPVKLSDDGIFEVPKDSLPHLEAWADQTSQEVGRDINVPTLLLAHAVAPEGMNCNSCLDEYLLWAEKRLRDGVRITREEIRDIGNSGHVLPIPVLTEVGSQCHVEDQGVATLVPIAVKLQKETGLPVEWHHFAFAMTEIGHELEARKGHIFEMEEDEYLPKCVDILEAFHSEHGCLPPVGFVEGEQNYARKS
jgi:hypothetical protein